MLSLSDDSFALPAPIASHGPLSAELLIAGIAPECWKALATSSELSLFSFEDTPAGDTSGAIAARVSFALAADDDINSPEPNYVRSRIAVLSNEIRRMPRLRIVLSHGISTHLAVLEACGMPLCRAEFRAGELTRLPDGLLIADIPYFEMTHEGDAPSETDQASLYSIMEKIRTVLSVDAMQNEMTAASGEHALPEQESAPAGRKPTRRSKS